jgi:hypothetical protein
MIRKQVAILLTIGLLAGAGVYAFLQDRDELGEMRLQLIAGDVRVERDGEALALEDEVALEAGDAIRTGSDGEARLRLAGGRRAWVAPQTRTVIVDTASLAVDGGHLLVTAEEAMQVSFDGVEATASKATFRVDQGAGAARAASYEGEVRISSPGQPRLEVPSLFEAQVLAGRLRTTVPPLQVREDDWDLQLMLPILDLDRTLTDRGEALQSQLRSERPGLDYFGGLVGKRVSFMRPLLKRPVKDLIIGFAIASNSTEAGLKRSVRRTFELRDQGGRWGVVAAIQRAKPKALMAELGNLIVATGVVGGGAPSEDGSASFTLASAQGGPGGGGPGGGSIISDTSGGSNPPGTSNPGPGNETDEPAEDCTDQADCARKELGKQVPTLPGSSPSPSPSDPPVSDSLLDKVRNPS